MGLVFGRITFSDTSIMGFSHNSPERHRLRRSARLSGDAWHRRSRRSFLVRAVIRMRAYRSRFDHADEHCRTGFLFCPSEGLWSSRGADCDGAYRAESIQAFLRARMLRSLVISSSTFEHSYAYNGQSARGYCFARTYRTDPLRWAERTIQSVGRWAADLLHDEISQQPDSRCRLSGGDGGSGRDTALTGKS